MSKQTSQSPARPANAPPEATMEALSCLVDGELDATHCDRLLRTLCDDPQVRLQWTLMHVTGDALRSSEVASLHSESFAARFSTALEAEPAIVAPHARRTAQRRSQSFVRRVALPGVAVAAAASVLVFVAVPQLRDPASGAGTTLTGTQPATTQAGLPPATLPQIAAQPGTQPATTPVQSTNGSGTSNGATSPTIVQRLPELDAYLAAHREQAGTSMMLRSAPYLRTSGTVPR